MHTNIQQCRELKTTLRQLRKASKELEEEIQVESRKGNKKILHEKLKIISLQRKKGLNLLKDLRKMHLSAF
jgi:hypothetical protein